MPWGRNLLTASSGLPIMLAAHPTVTWKTGGITIDWGTVAAVGSDTLIPVEGVTVKNGGKYLRYGQPMLQITNPTVQTITITGTPTSGSFTVTGVRPDLGSGTTATIAYNAAVSATQTAMDSIFGAGNTVVTGSGALPGNVHTVTFQGALQYLTIAAMVASGAGLLGGTAPAVAVAATNAGGNTGRFGPYDAAASDGRQTPTKGRIVLLNRTIVQAGVLGFTTADTDHAGGIIGGPVFRDRILATTGTHSLAAGPTFTELEAVMGSLQYVMN